ncbi:MAG: Aldehyde Dehydrogenase [Frankiales bacterium]|nr:Aldehyde Dehydrogenase [Frankiales bacterium]
MTTTLDTSTFDSYDPATGAVLTTWPVHGADEVEAAVRRARTASVVWAGFGFAGRKQRLTAWKAEIARQLPDLAAVVHAENGKPFPDAVLEVTLAVDHIAWAAKSAKRVLGSRRVRSGAMAANQASTLEYPPLGVVGVIGPWNYPVFTPMGSLAYALAAGNAVVFKPSEHTPAVGAWLVEAWKRAVPDSPDVLQLVTGMGPTGAALCRAGVDKIAFTGSAATGRKVMSACSEGLVPVLMECGGKDAMIVADGADVSAAADAALWGAMSNAGQTCIGIERVYVTEGSYDAFVTEITSKAATLKPGSGEGASYGPITMPSQVGIIERHIADAIASGGRATTGGTVDGPFVSPTVLVDVPETSTAVTEETFGPTVTVTKVRDAEEALRRTNATSYGLAGSVFASSSKAGMDIARRMRSGMTSVNSVIAFASVPGLPFGGVGESGFGRIHGDDGLREFSRAKAITRQRFGLPVALTSFDRPEKVTGQLVKAVKLLHGRG